MITNNTWKCLSKLKFNFETEFLKCNYRKNARLYYINIKLYSGAYRAIVHNEYRNVTAWPAGGQQVEQLLDDDLGLHSGTMLSSSLVEDI